MPTSSPSPSLHDEDIHDLIDEAADFEDKINPEDAWNLVPYHIPWGSFYHGYKAGTLPGPDGKCIFLRSPTPLKNQRTGQACEKCRERKAKVRLAIESKVRNLVLFALNSVVVLDRHAHVVSPGDTSANIALR